MDIASEGHGETCKGKIMGFQDGRHIAGKREGQSHTDICLHYIFFYLGLGFEETLIDIILIDVKMSTMIQPAIIVWFSTTPAYIFFHNK